MHDGFLFAYPIDSPVDMYHEELQTELTKWSSDTFDLPVKISLTVHTAEDLFQDI